VFRFKMGGGIGNEKGLREPFGPREGIFWPLYIGAEDHWGEGGGARGMKEGSFGGVEANREMGVGWFRKGSSIFYRGVCLLWKRCR